MAREAVAVAHACVHARPVAAGDIATIVSRKRKIAKCRTINAAGEATQAIGISFVQGIERLRD
jgi:hypothetical protein